MSIQKKIATSLCAIFLSAAAAQFSLPAHADITANYNSLSSVDNRSKSVWRSSLSGYMNTHNIDVSDLATGLQIPFIYETSWREYWGSLIATGNISDNNCPIMDVVVSTQILSGTITTQKYNAVEICP